jgi:trimethylamine:corrinoid methyltransferase-like protein
LAGSLAQAFAETLGSLVCVNLVRPKTAMSFGMWPFIADLRTGAFSGGSGEQALVMAATSQICNYYGLVSSVATGMTDSKTMDAQAGYEKAKKMLADYYPEHIKPEVDQRIRDKFDIRIVPAEMKRGNGRW